MVLAGVAGFALLGLLVAVFVRPLLAVSQVIDVTNVWIGRIFAWAILLAVVIATVNAIIRKLFDISSNSWLEMQWILFGAVFLLCASWTLRVNEHIRIDIVSSALSARTRSWIDWFGHLFFLLPVTLLMIVTSYPFVMRSIMQNEQSTNAGGLPVYPSKALILLGFSLLLLQGLSELIKRTAILRGLRSEEAAGGHHAAAEAEALRLKEALAEEARLREAQELAERTVGQRK